MALIGARTSMMRLTSSAKPLSSTAPIRRVARLNREPRTSFVCRAEEETAASAAPETSTSASSSTTVTTSAPAGASQAPVDAPEAPVLVKGQGTAIITGAISIIFGVAYLVLVSLLDSRGGELLPPPPEAFIP